MNKICSNCKIEKSVEDFHKDARGIFGVRADCKACALEKKKIYTKNNAEKNGIRNKIWRAENQDYLKSYEKGRLPIRNEKRKIRYKTDISFKEAILDSVKRYRTDPKNRDIIRATQKKIRDRYTATKPEYRIIRSLRRRMLFVLHGKRKCDTSIKLIGCTGLELKQRLEALWTIGMSWDNYGVKGWHIDHIIPCSSFDLSDNEQQKKCFHYTNLQPLWARDNLKKGDCYL